MSAPTERRIALPTLSIAAQVWGDDDAPPLLALHGWLDNAASHTLLAPLLARRYRVIALDLPGHGLSDHLPAGADYHWPSYVQAVIACADALGLERYALLGHSLGAGVASMVAAATPSRIERLLLIEGLGLLGDDGTDTLQRFRDGMQAAQRDSKPRRVFSSIEQALRARALASGLSAELARPIIERALQPVEGGWRWRSDPRLTRPTPLRIAESQIHTLLRGIAAPTSLLLALPTTPYLPNEPMARRAACVRDIRISHLQGGHHLHLEHPQAVASWLLG
jgi:pimeloyl-ACP methyl ester carboxylesterase